MADKKQKKKKREAKDDSLLKEIIELGGSKNDLKLVEGIDDNEESDIDCPKEDFEAEPIKRDEIQEFLKSLDIYKYRPDQGDNEQSEKKEKKKKKEVTAVEEEEEEENKGEEEEDDEWEDDDDEEEEEEIDEEEEGQQQASSSSQVTESKKKEKNKYKIQHEEITSTTRDFTHELGTHIQAYRPRGYLLVKTGGEFYDTQASSVPVEPPSQKIQKQMEEFAAKLLHDEITVYNKQREKAKRSDVGWMKTVLTSGTLADKMAALTVLVQESPLHNLAHLDTLIAMAKKKGKRECLLATDTLRELFLADLLPEDRKLKSLGQHSLSTLGESAGWNKDSIDRKLLLWYCESQVKEKYESFVKALQVLSHDTLPATKQKGVNTVYQLLVKKPEQEKMLLTLLINKIGDPYYKLAASVSHLLTQLVENHPNMKMVVVRELEQLLFRPNIPARAQYYSVCFLNQLRFSHSQKDLALKVIKICFSFFKMFVKKGEVDSKMMSALLTGINRAFPYAKVDAQFLSEHMEHLYKTVHMVNFNTSIQALMLLYQVMDTSTSVSDRYYVALYKKLSDPGLKHSSKQSMFLNLIFKSIQKDTSERRVKAFVKRLLQVCSFQPPQFTCGALVLLSEMLKSKTGLLTVSHLEDDSDDEEHFVDLPGPDSDDEGVSPGGGDKAQRQQVDSDDDSGQEDRHRESQTGAKPSWVHRSNTGSAGRAASQNYNPYHRNPQFCFAEHECFWELGRLSQHFHPTVALFAQQILKGQSVQYNGDPLQDFTLIRFLDRFVYKNPKKHEHVEEKVATVSRHVYNPTGIRAVPVNSEQFINLEESSVPVDDKFYHRFFTQKEAKKKKKGDVSDEDSDAESISDSEFDSYLDNFEKNFDDGATEMDFAWDFEKKKAAKKGKASKEADESDEDEDDDLENLSDEEVEFSDDGDLGEIDDSDMDEEGFNEEDVDFSDDDDLEELTPGKKAKKRKAAEEDALMFGTKKSKKGDPTSLFAAAEEFSHMIDENTGSQFDMIGANALSNKDKASVKQLQWEVDRDRWLKGKDWKAAKKGGNSARKQKGKSGGKSTRKPGPQRLQKGKQKQSGNRGKSKKKK